MRCWSSWSAWETDSVVKLSARASSSHLFSSGTALLCGFLNCPWTFGLCTPPLFGYSLSGLLNQWERERDVTSIVPLFPSPFSIFILPCSLTLALGVIGEIEQRLGALWIEATLPSTKYKFNIFLMTWLSSLQFWIQLFCRALCFVVLLNYEILSSVICCDTVSDSSWLWHE